MTQRPEPTGLFYLFWFTWAVVIVLGLGFSAVNMYLEAKQQIDAALEVLQ